MNLIEYNKASNQAKYSAIIVETRWYTALSFVLENFLSNLSEDWNVLIFHSNTNKLYIDEIINNHLQLYIYRITTFELPINNLDTNMYNKLLVNPEFYKYIPTEIFLIFQTDSMIFRQNKHLIDDYLGYDYVGAPWKRGQCVGNGGLSLRRKTKMLEIINRKPYRGENEDIYFSKYLGNINLHKPNFQKAKRFSVETVFNDTSFGTHKCWLYMTKNQLNHLISKHDGLKTLIALQGVW